MAIEKVELDRKTGAGRYAGAIDVAELLGRERYGSATNALWNMVLESPLYQETLARLKLNGKASSKTHAA